MQDFPPVQAYLTPVNARIIPILAAACLLLAGCHHDTTTPTTTTASSPADQATAANALFLNQKNFDPWVLSTTDMDRMIDVYLQRWSVGSQFNATRK